MISFKEADKEERINDIEERQQALEKRVAEQELRSRKSDMKNLEFRIEKMEREVRMGEEVIAKAVEENNGNDAAQAIRLRDDALNELRELIAELAEKKMENSLEENKIRTKIINPAPKLTLNSRGEIKVGTKCDKATAAEQYERDFEAFLKKHQIYDIDHRGIIDSILRKLTNDGYLDHVEAYWVEAERLVRLNLPRYFDYEELENEMEKEAEANTKSVNWAKNLKEALRKPDEDTRYWLSPVELLDDEVLAAHKACQWADRNAWYDKASHTQKKILNCLHDLLLAKGLSTQSNEYWQNLDSLIAHVHLDGFKEPEIKKELTAQERLLAIAERMANKIELELNNAEASQKSKVPKAPVAKAAAKPKKTWSRRPKNGNAVKSNPLKQGEKQDEKTDG